jgi:hypothetical protein
MPVMTCNQRKAKFIQSQAMAYSYIPFSLNSGSMGKANAKEKRDNAPISFKKIFKMVEGETV